MIFTLPHIFRDGESLDVNRVNENIDAMREYLSALRERRYMSCDVSFDLEGADPNTSPGEGTFAIADTAETERFRVRAVRISFASTSSGNYTVSIGTSFSAVVAGSGSASTLAEYYFPCDHLVDDLISADEITITPTGHTTAISHGTITLSVVHNRLAGLEELAAFNRFKGGDTITGAAIDLALSGFADATSKNAARAPQTLYHLHAKNIPTGSTYEIGRFPSTGATVIGAVAYISEGTGSATVNIKDQNGDVQATLTPALPASGLGSDEDAIDVIQTANAPADASKDWRVEVSHAKGSDVAHVGVMLVVEQPIDLLWATDDEWTFEAFPGVLSTDAERILDNWDPEPEAETDNIWTFESGF